MLWGVTFYGIAASEWIKNLSNRHNYAVVYFGFVAAVLISLFVILLFSSALRMGEQLYHLRKCYEEKPSLSLLVSFFGFKKSSGCFRLYAITNLFKLCWLVYYLSPAIICGGIAFFLYTYADIPPQAFYVLLSGILLFLSLSLFVWRITCLRYCCAPLFFAENNLSPVEAINKSISSTDGILSKTALLEASFWGWFLSCLLIIPVFYVLPYYRLSKAMLIYDHITSQKNVFDFPLGEHI